MCVCMCVFVGVYSCVWRGDPGLFHVLSLQALYNLMAKRIQELTEHKYVYSISLDVCFMLS